MMTSKEIRTIIGDSYSDFSFSFKGKIGGVLISAKDGKVTWLLWYGEQEKKLHDINDVMSEKMFEGKSLEDIAGEIELPY